MKKHILYLLLLPFLSSAQTTTFLDSVQAQARAHFPLVKQQWLLRESASTTHAALNRSYLPQVSIGVQASYQSEVTALPFQLPFAGVTIETLAKDQYRAVGEVQQLLYDGGQIALQKEIQHRMTTVEEEMVNVELQALHEQITELYLGILMLDEQLIQTELVGTDLEAGIRRMESALRNGTAYRSQLAQLQAEALKNRQRSIELGSMREGLLKTLGLYTGITYPINIRLEKPTALPVSGATTLLIRPELEVFKARESLLQTQSRSSTVKAMPRVSLFGQGGYGRPGLNMLKNDFDWFYIGGARLQWNFSTLYTLSADRKVNRLQQSLLQNQKESYVMRAEARLIHLRQESDKTEKLLETDKELITLREEIMMASKAQLDNGVITPADYIREVNAADQARQQFTLHTLQLLRTRLQYADYTKQYNTHP